MFLDYMESVLGEARMSTSGVEANFDCPFCSDTRHRFRMNVYKLRGYCFNCQWKGNAVSFVRDFNHVNSTEAFDIVNFYQDFKPLPQDVYEEVFDELFMSDIELEKRYIPLPSDFKLLHNTKSVQAKRFLKYAQKRHLTEEQIEVHGVGWCPDGEIVIKNSKGEEKRTFLRERLIVQAFGDNNKPVYWNARAINDKIKPKSFNPVGGFNTINKTDVLFNLNNAKKHGVAVLGEGVFDATAIGKYGICGFGKTLAMNQLIQLIKADLEALYIMYDPDALGDAIKTCGMTFKHIPTYLCTLDGGDPDEVGKKGIAKALKTAEKFDNFTALKYKLLN